MISEKKKIQDLSQHQFCYEIASPDGDVMNLRQIPCEFVLRRRYFSSLNWLSVGRLIDREWEQYHSSVTIWQKKWKKKEEFNSYR